MVILTIQNDFLSSSLTLTFQKIILELSFKLLLMSRR